MREEGIQQGIAHAVIAPHALEYLFEHVDGRRDLLADSLGVSDDQDTAAGVVSAVADVRNGMGLPARLRDLDEMEEDALPRIAHVVARDRFMNNAPEGLEASEGELLDVLEGAW